MESFLNRFFFVFLHAIFVCILDKCTIIISNVFAIVANAFAIVIHFRPPFGRYPTFHTLTSVGRKSSQYGKEGTAFSRNIDVTNATYGTYNESFYYY